MSIKLDKLNGQQLYYALSAGINNLIAHQKTLDEINAADKPSVMVFNKVDAFTYEKKDEDDLTPATKANISLAEWKRTWMAKSGDSIFISALQKDNFDTFRDKLYEMAKEIHAKRFPYNSFLY